MGHRVVSGIRFEGVSGEETTLGFLHPNRETSLNLPTGSTIHGWKLARDETGIKAIAALLVDGTFTPWAGEHEGFPRRLLVENYAKCTSVKAEFDVRSILF